jgi:hypothetical protein
VQFSSLPQAQKTLLPALYRRDSAFAQIIYAFDWYLRKGNLCFWTAPSLGTPYDMMPRQDSE